MRLSHTLALAAAIVTFMPSAVHAQAPSETSRTVEGGGISAPGWTGKIDASEEAKGQTLNNAKLSEEGGVLHVTTGPAVTYWNPANKATGDYTVKATFNEPKYMNLNSHPHPYGLVIAGNFFFSRWTPKWAAFYAAAGALGVATGISERKPWEGVACGLLCTAIVIASLAASRARRKREAGHG